MQRLSRECAQHRRELRIVDLGPTRLAVRRIPDQWPAARGQMHPDLVGSSGREAAAEQRQPRARRRDARQPFESGETLRANGDRRDHLAAVVAIAPQPQIDLAPRHVHAAIDDRQIVLFGVVGRHRALHRGVRGRRLGADEERQVRHLVDELIGFGLGRSHLNDLLGMRIRQRPQEDRIDDREDCAVRADAERQREHRDQCEPRGLAQGAECELQGFHA